MKPLPFLDPKFRRAMGLVGGGVCLVALVVASSCLHGRSRQVLKSCVGTDLSEQASVACTPPPMPMHENMAPRHVIRTARVELEVKSFEAFETACRELAKRHGYLADLSLTRDEHGRIRADLTLRVAAERFDQAFEAFKSLGVVQNEEMKVEDVTQTCADLEARCLNQRTTAARLREIIANRAGKLSEVVEAEKALGEVTAELESMEAQKRAMEGRIAYGTLRAQVHEAGAVPKEPGPFAQAVREGFAGLTTGLAWVCRILITLSPWLLLAALGAWGWWRRRRKRIVKAESSKD